MKYIIDALGKFGLRVRTRYAEQEKGGNPLAYSNTDSARLKLLCEALNAPGSKAVWGIAGGAGSTNLLPPLVGTPPPLVKKPLIGFSYVTGIHLLLNKKWNWQTIHGVLAVSNQEVDAHTKKIVNKDTSLKSVVVLLMGRVTQLNYPNLMPLNTPAKAVKELSTTLIDGNLLLLCTSFGTPFGPSNRPFTLLVEGLATLHIN